MAKNKPAAMPEYKTPSVDELYESRMKQDEYQRNERIADGRIVAHDACGVETDRIDWSAYDDGYGNKIAHGDMSMQRMVEKGEGRSSGYVRPYDTEPCMGKGKK